MHRNAVAEMPWVLENTESFIFKKIENTVYARFTQEPLQLIFKISFNLSSLLRYLTYLSLLN